MKVEKIEEKQGPRGRYYNLTADGKTYFCGGHAAEVVGHLSVGDEVTVEAKTGKFGLIARTIAVGAGGPPTGVVGGDKNLGWDDIKYRFLVSQLTELRAEHKIPRQEAVKLVEESFKDAALILSGGASDAIKKEVEQGAVDLGINVKGRAWRDYIHERISSLDEVLKNIKATKEGDMDVSFDGNGAPVFVAQGEANDKNR